MIFIDKHGNVMYEEQVRRMKESQRKLISKVIFDEGEI